MLRMTHAGRESTRRVGRTSLIVVSGLVLAACSTANSGASSGPAGGPVPASVSSNLSKYSGLVTPSYGGPAFDASAAKGKTVWWVPQSTGNPFLAILGENFVAALESQGVKVTTCDGKNNPVDGNSCISQAISQKASAIQIDGPEPRTFAAPLADAKRAGIPVLSGAAVDASDPLYEGLAGQSSQTFKLSGTLLADWVTKDSGGSAHVLFITTPDVVGSTEEDKAFGEELAKVCPNCKSVVKGVTLANWATDIAPATSAGLLRDPKVNYVIPAFDPMAQFTNPAIQQAGKSVTVKVVTANGSLQQMQQLQSGNLVTMEVGEDLNALGYIEADLVLRTLTRQPALTTFPIGPVRVFDKSNIKGLTMTKDAQATGQWFTKNPSDYVDFFIKLWKG